MKDYHSSKVQEILDKYVTADKYGEYKPILDEIVQRRQFEFEFSLERTEQEVKNMVRMLNEIKIGNQEQDVLAEYSYNQKVILLNEDVLKREYKFYKDIIYNLDDVVDKEKELSTLVGKKLFSIFAHEVYHTMNFRDEAMCGVEHKTGFGGMLHTTGIELNEIITERAATRITEEKSTSKMKQGFERTVGYDHMTFISNMIAYSLGVSEKELLEKGLSNHKELVRFVSSKFGNDTKKGEEVVETIEYAATYFSKTFIQMNDPQKNVAKGLTRICNDFFEIAENQTSLDDREISPEYLGEIFYRNYKLNSAINNYADLLLRNDCITSEGLADFFNNTLETRQRYLEALLGMADLAQMGCTTPSAVQAAKNGYLKKYARYRKENGEPKEEGETTRIRRSIKNFK